MKKLILLSLISLSSLKAIEVKVDGVNLKDWESKVLEGYEHFNDWTEEEKLECEYRAKVYENLLLRCQRALEKKLDAKIAGGSKEDFYCNFVAILVATFKEKKALEAAFSENKQ